MNTENEHEPELTAKAIATGLVAGGLLAIGNVYMGLKTGWWESGGITSSILGFALFASLRRRYTILENNVTQSTAVATAAMPSTMGLLGAIPALTLSNISVSPVGLLLWGLLLGLFGAGIGYMLRRRYIEEDNLPFPSGVAVAEVIASMHGGADKPDAPTEPRARALTITGLVSAAWVWLRDGKPTVIPGDWMLPFSLRGIAAADLTLGISMSPMMFGLGFLIGPRTGLSLALGAVIGWAVLSPDLLAHHLVPHADYSALVSWLMWPGVALMLAPSLLMLLSQARFLLGAIADLTKLRQKRTASRSILLWICLSAALPLLVVGWWTFSLHPLVTIAALALTVIFASACARAAGETDISPVGPIGQFTQIIFGSASSHALVNIAAGSITSGAAAQTATGLWSYRTGQILRSKPSRLFAAQAIGIVFGSLVSIPVYLLIVHAYGVGTEAMPAQNGVTWKALSLLLTQGGHSIPPYAGIAAVIAFCVGLGCTWLGKTRFAFLCPAPMAIGVAMITPAEYSFSMCIGSLILYACLRMSRTKTESLASSIGAGAVAGESLTGVLIALLNWLGWLHR